jgi:hypothetical protein
MQILIVEKGADLADELHSLLGLYTRVGYAAPASLSAGLEELLGQKCAAIVLTADMKAGDVPITPPEGGLDAAELRAEQRVRRAGGAAAPPPASGRRARPAAATRRALCIGDLRLNAAGQQLTCAGRLVSLPRKCLRLLRRMMGEPNRVFSHGELMRAGWGRGAVNSHTLRTHMYMLRRTLAAHGHPDLIETIHGAGYRLARPDHA